MDPHARASMNAFAVLAGWILLILGASGAVYGSVVAAAQTLYFTAKYGAAREDLPRALSLLEAAYRIYPHNFRGSLVAAERAWAESERADGPEASGRWRKVSEMWCERGLRANPNERSLRFRWAACLSERDLPAAIRYMEDYVTWHFWHPWNHAVLAELYARAGDFDRADQSLFWVRQNPQYDRIARERVRIAKDRYLGGLQASPVPGR